MASHVAVVALRSFAGAKARLRERMSDAGRELLVERMAAHVVATAQQLMPVAVVSVDPIVLAWAERAGALPIRETAPPVPELPAPESIDAPAARDESLNEAVTDGALWATAVGAKVLVVLAADLPAVSTADLAALIRLPGRPGLVVASDKFGTGTNAIAVSPPQALIPNFGPNSLQAHLSDAYRAGLRVRRLSRPGLAFDLDTPDDFDAALAHGGLPGVDPYLLAAEVGR